MNSFRSRLAQRIRPIPRPECLEVLFETIPYPTKGVYELDDFDFHLPETPQVEAEKFAFETAPHLDGNGFQFPAPSTTASPLLAATDVESLNFGLLCGEHCAAISLLPETQSVAVNLLDSLPTQVSPFRELSKSTVHAEEFLIPFPELEDHPRLKNLTSPAIKSLEFQIPAARTIARQLDQLSVSKQEVKISTNLFVALKTPRIDGKAYVDAVSWPQLQRPRAIAEKQPRKEGFRKSFEEPKDNWYGRREIMSVWDLLLPVLEPPLRLDLGELLDLPSPLWGYQYKGVEFLVDSPSALLGDDMGTGKTVQTAVAMRMLFQMAKIRSALVVCPLSVLPGWDRELAAWASNLSVTVVRGSKQHREICWQRPAHIWLTTYDTLRNDIETVLRSRQDGFGLVVADEAQKIKSPSIGISRALREISAEFKWGLTGTPLENSLDDVFSIFAFLKPGLFKVMWYRADEVKTIMQPYFLRRRKQDVLTDLPAIREDEVWLQLENEQRASYDRLEREGVLDLHQRGRDAITTTSILSLLTKLKQVCNRCPASDESSKLTWLRDSLESITAEGDKALIFTQYKLEDKSGADWLEKELLEYGVLNYGQATSDSKRAGLLKRFQNDPSQKVFIGHPKTAGLGLNELVAANYVIHFDHWWNPATTNQATARAHRPGQKKSVLVYHLWVQDTVEEMILSKVKQKLQLYNEVIDSLSAEISASDLSKVYWDVWNDLEKKYGLKITSKPSPQENVPIPPSRRTNL